MLKKVKFFNKMWQVVRRPDFLLIWPVKFFSRVNLARHRQFGAFKVPVG